MTKKKTMKKTVKSNMPEQLTDKQEDCVCLIAQHERVTGKKARKYYFNELAKMKKAGKTEADLQKTIMKMDDIATMAKQAVGEAVPTLVAQVKKRAVGGAIKDTKLGVTMVLSHKDCADMGFIDTTVTREVIRQARVKLGLPEKPQRA